MTTNFEEGTANWKKAYAGLVLIKLSDNAKNNAELLFIELLLSENTVRKNCSEEYWNIWPSENLVTFLTQHGISESVGASAFHYFKKYKNLLGLSEEQIKAVAATDQEFYTILQNAFGLNT
jgi:hypothetical protein